MNCPICITEQLSISSREGVEIDYCPKCRGVWLDRGELDKIIDRAAAEIGGGGAPPAPPPPREREREREPERDYREPRYDDRHQQHYDPRKKKKKRSFLDDIFDFD